MEPSQFIHGLLFTIFGCGFYLEKISRKSSKPGGLKVYSDGMLNETRLRRSRIVIFSRSEISGRAMFNSSGIDVSRIMTFL